MFSCDSSFTVAKNFALDIISKCDAITCSVMLLKGCEHFLFSGHMIGASTIKHPTYFTRGVGLQEQIKPWF
jgi:hypothetical protein